MSIESYLTLTQDDKVTEWIEKNLNNFLKKNFSKFKRHEIEHAIDYLNKQHAGKDLKRMSVEQAIKHADEWTKKLCQEHESVCAEDGTNHIADLADGYKLVQLVNKSAFVYEGKMMNHCVASYSGHQGIYSIRTKKNKPVCTIEVSYNQVRQIKGFSNQEVKDECQQYANEAIEILTEKLQLTGGYRSYELQNMGYQALPVKFIKEVNKIYGKDVFKTIKSGRRTYAMLTEELKPKKAINMKSESAFLWACRYSYALTKMLIKANKCFIATRYYHSMWLAARSGNIETLKLLRKHGGELIPEKVNAYAQPLSVLCRNGYLETLKWALSQVDHKDIKPKIKDEMFNSVTNPQSDIVHRDVLDYLLEVKLRPGPAFYLRGRAFDKLETWFLITQPSKETLSKILKSSLTGVHKPHLTERFYKLLLSCGAKKCTEKFLLKAISSNDSRYGQRCGARTNNTIEYMKAAKVDLRNVNLVRTCIRSSGIKEYFEFFKQEDIEVHKYVVSVTEAAWSKSPQLLIDYAKNTKRNKKDVLKIYDMEAIFNIYDMEAIFNNWNNSNALVAAMPILLEKGFVRDKDLKKIKSKSIRGRYDGSCDDSIKHGMAVINNIIVPLHVRLMKKYLKKIVDKTFYRFSKLVTYFNQLEERY
jgi:hypothetical protein